MPQALETVPEPFLTIVTRLIEREGGSRYTDHPLDKGGPTKYGITIPALSTYLGRKATAAEIQALDLPTAQKLYHSVFWMQPKIYLINNRWVAEMTFDWACGSGPGLAVKKLQEFLGITRDGKIGPVTLRAVSDGLNRAKSFEDFWDDLCDFRIRHFIRICKNDPSQLVFMEGWFNRIAKIRKLPRARV